MAEKGRSLFCLAFAMDWSINGQTPEFLAATRMISLADSIVHTILTNVPLEAGMNVLDVGCGSGEYCFRLGSAVEGVRFTGLEYDPHFVEFANARARGEVGYPFEQPSPLNEYRFVCGDGLDLPFDDGTFDAVISHTYLTALPDWATALAEMCRVCKPGGIVSSITSLTDDFYGTGTIELFSGLLEGEDAEVVARVNAAKTDLIETMTLAPGIAPRKAPVAFEWIGLERVHCTPLAHYFCLSDADIDADDYIRYVDLLCEMERKQLARLSQAARDVSSNEKEQQAACEHAPRALSPSATSGLRESDLDRYAELIEQRRDYLIGSMGANREWDWYGNASLLVSGTVPLQGPSDKCATLRADMQKARQFVASCENVSLQVTCRDMAQLGPGRCVESTFGTSGDQRVTVFGFDPPSAIVEGHAKLLACELDRRRGAALNNNPAHQPLPPDAAALELAVKERHYEEIERQLDPSLCTSTLPEYPAEAVFDSSAMWETVSEAALSGMSVSFRDAGAILAEDGADLFAIVCTAEFDHRKSCGISVHASCQTAAQRALARALGHLRQ